MKKILVLPLFAMAVLVSQASGKTMCLYGSGDCWPADAKDCQGGWKFDGGKEGKGTLCEGGTFIENGDGTKGDPPTGTATMLGCCDWEKAGKCFGVFSQDQADDCQTADNVWYPGKDACPNDEKGTCGPSSGGSEDEGPFCYWAPNADNENTCYCGVVQGEAATEENCTDDWGEIVTSCSGKCSSTPILKFAHSAALIVAPYGRSLHISSIREATISLYDMSGVRVYSGKVRAGNSVFGLEKVASGSYYAIVQAGSDSKKVPIILK